MSGLSSSPSSGGGVPPNTPSRTRGMALQNELNHTEDLSNRRRRPPPGTPNPGKKRRLRPLDGNAFSPKNLKVSIEDNEHFRKAIMSAINESIKEVLSKDSPTVQELLDTLKKEITPIKKEDAVGTPSSTHTSQEYKLANLSDSFKSKRRSNNVLEVVKKFRELRSHKDEDKTFEMKEVKRLHSLNRSNKRGKVGSELMVSIRRNSITNSNTMESFAFKPRTYEDQLNNSYPGLYEAFNAYQYQLDGKIPTQCMEDFIGTNVQEIWAWNKEAKKSYKAIDTNGDGFVTFEELVVWMHRRKSSYEESISKPRLSIKSKSKKDFRGIAKQVQNLITKPHAAFEPEGNQVYMNNFLTSEDIPAELGEVVKPWYIIHPESSFHIIWDLVIVIILLITLIALPVNLAFEEINESLYRFNLFCDILFMLDIFKSFFTGIVDKDDIIWLSHKVIVRTYLFTWFFPDLVSSIPMDLILVKIESDNELAGTTQSFKLLKLTRLAKLFRVFRVGRVYRYLKACSKFIEKRFGLTIDDSTVKMLKLLLALIMVAHYIGCIQFMVCRLMDFPEESWVAVADLAYADVKQQYSWSFFKALAQMIGIGFEKPPITNLSCEEITPWCTVEMWLTLICMYIGTLFYAILISIMSSIILSMNYAARLFRQKTQQIDEYMKTKRLPLNLRHKVRDYYHLRYSEGKMFDENEIMKDLSPALQKEILMYTCKDLFWIVPFLRKSGAGFSSSIATSLTPIVAFESDLIAEEGTTGNSMFFVYSGQVEIFIDNLKKEKKIQPPKKDSYSYRKNSTKITPLSVIEDEEAPKEKENDNSEIIIKIGKGCFFGEISCILNVRRIASARTTETSILYELSRQQLNETLKDFPEIYKILHDVSISRITSMKKRVESVAKGNTKASESTDSTDFHDMQAATLNRSDHHRVTNL